MNEKELFRGKYTKEEFKEKIESTSYHGDYGIELTLKENYDEDNPYYYEATKPYDDVKGFEFKEDFLLSSDDEDYLAYWYDGNEYSILNDEAYFVHYASSLAKFTRKKLKDLTALQSTCGQQGKEIENLCKQIDMLCSGTEAGKRIAELGKSNKQLINEKQDLCLTYECVQKSVGMCWFGRFGKTTECIGIKKCHQEITAENDRLREALKESLKIKDEVKEYLKCNVADNSWVEADIDVCFEDFEKLTTTALAPAPEGGEGKKEPEKSADDKFRLKFGRLPERYGDAVCDKCGEPSEKCRLKSGVIYCENCNKPTSQGASHDSK